jgi:hypothetical protein
VRPDWALGFADETWWSRFATPALHAWAEPGRPLRLVEQPGGDAEPKALAAYGLYLPTPNEILLRFVDGRPVGTLRSRHARNTGSKTLYWPGCSPSKSCARQRAWGTSSAGSASTS